MRKSNLWILAAASLALSASAYDIVRLNLVNGSSRQYNAEEVTEINYSNDKQNVVVSLSNGSSESVPTAQLKDICFTPVEEQISVIYKDATAEVINGYAEEDVTIAIDGAKVIITPAIGKEIICFASGNSTEGQLKFYGDSKVDLTLDNLSLTNTNGSALNFQTAGDINVTLNGRNTLCDSEKYDKVASPVDGKNEKENGTVHATGAITFDGDGSLTLTSLNKHGVTAAAITLQGVDIEVLSAANDGLHADAFEMTGGSYKSANTIGDGIDAGAGNLVINSGKVDITLAEADTKCLKADTDVVINGGEFTLVSSGGQSKAISAKKNMEINGGTFDITLTGDAVLEPVLDAEGNPYEDRFDPSYSTAFKPKGDFTMNGGSIKVVTTGKGGKGISVDGNAKFYAGSVDITCSGHGELFNDATGATDCYSSTCITVDGGLYIYGGTFNLLNSGNAGKCLKSDGVMEIGTESAGPNITARTTGERISVNSSGSGNTGGTTGPGGRPGGNWGGGGWGPGMENGNYSNPKCVKAVDNLTVYNGFLALSTTGNGGEGLESKQTLNIKGGDICIVAKDDGINAAKHIQFDGGVTRVVSTSNDGIDSNGTLTVNDGIVIAMGYSGAECGFDCDNNRFEVNGGIILGLGGSTSSITSAASTVTKGSPNGFNMGTQFVTLVDPDGKPVATFKSALSSGRLLYATNNTSYKVYQGGTLTGGETILDRFVVGATAYTPGTALSIW